MLRDYRFTLLFTFETKMFRIIFTFKGNYSKICELGDHVMLTDWAPQKELIAHNKTKVFISHGGLKR